MGKDGTKLMEWMRKDLAEKETARKAQRKSLPGLLAARDALSRLLTKRDREALLAAQRELSPLPFKLKADPATMRALFGPKPERPTSRFALETFGRVRTLASEGIPMPEMPTLRSQPLPMRLTLADLTSITNDTEEGGDHGRN